MTLDILGTMRAIRDDASLTTTQAYLLTCALLRADNNSCRVRYSIEKLAVDAKVSDKTARTAFKNDNVLKYFERVDRATRQVNMWFHPTPVMVTAVDMTPVMVTGVTPVTESTTPVIDATDSGNPVHDSGNGYRPSTLSSTLSSTSTSTSRKTSGTKKVNPTSFDSEHNDDDDRATGTPSASPQTAGIDGLQNFSDFSLNLEKDAVEKTFNERNIMHTGVRTTKIGNAQAFAEGEECFNYFESSLTEKTGTPTTALWHGSRLQWLAVMKTITKQHAMHLIDVWMSSNTQDGSQEAFLRSWTKVHDVDMLQKQDKAHREVLRSASEARSAAWEARTKRLGTPPPKQKEMTLEEQREAAMTLEVPPWKPKEVDENEW